MLRGGSSTIVHVSDFWHCLPMGSRSAETNDTPRAAHGVVPSDHGSGSADQDKHQRSWLDIVENDALKPFANSALIDSYNALANGVNLVTSHTGMGEAMTQKERWEVKDAKAYTGEWAVQTAFRGLGSLVPYTIAGTAVGGGMRALGASLGVEGTAAAVLKDQTLAYAGGAALYDGSRNVNPGETRLGNMLG